jgi:hypothetical protein
LRNVADAYLRRRAKARIEKVARMQKLAVITRELAVPLIEETVGSDRLEGSEAQESAPDEASVTALTPASPRSQPQSPVSSAEVPRPLPETSQPHLNWTNTEGQLNEVAAGRVVVVPPSVHNRQE